jgi:predicted RNA-binding Zn ribbon-like protein
MGSQRPVAYGINLFATPELVTRIMVFLSALSAQDLAPPNNPYAHQTANLYLFPTPSSISTAIADGRAGSLEACPETGC